MSILITAFVTFILAFILVPIFLGIIRLFGVYAIVNEGTCHVYVLFGKVVAVLTEPAGPSDLAGRPLMVNANAPASPI